MEYRRGVFTTTFLMGSVYAYQFGSFINGKHLVAYCHPPVHLACDVHAALHGIAEIGDAAHHYTQIDGFPLVVTEGTLHEAISMLDDKLHTVMSGDIATYMARVDDCWERLLVEQDYTAINQPTSLVEGLSWGQVG